MYIIIQKERKAGLLANIWGVVADIGYVAADVDVVAVVGDVLANVWMMWEGLVMPVMVGVAEKLNHRQSSVEIVVVVDFGGVDSALHSERVGYEV